MAVPWKMWLVQMYFLLKYLAVEVRQGTLAAEARGWGPAGNTERRWSWLRSGREHWTWQLAVEGWQHDDEEGRLRRLALEGSTTTKEEEEKEEEEEDEKADIKSNNPHLTGGEKHWG